MKDFNIIPVIDILNKEAVHAIKGEREKYKALTSHLFKSTNPIEILKVLNEEYHFRKFYIADLDAIIKKSPNNDLILQIIDSLPIDIIIDPGIVSLDDVGQYSEYRLKKLILGLETIESPDVISGCLNILGSKKTIVSIDMYNEKIQTNIKEYKRHDSWDIVKQIQDLGVTSIILLDLLKVGQKIGGISPVYLKIRDLFNGEILVGGGIKDLNDILRYRSQNFSGVLVGTALYDGTINMKKLQNLL